MRVSDEERPITLGKIDGKGTPTDPTIELFEKAVQNHSRRLLAIARTEIVGTRASPEDVVQQAVTNLFQHRARYDWREPGGLLKRAVVNESLRLLRHPHEHGGRRASRHHRHTGRPGGRRERNGRSGSQGDCEIAGSLPAALVLCEYENLSYQQIAETLNASVPQVKTWIHRARRQLEGMLKDYVESGRKEPAQAAVEKK